MPVTSDDVKAAYEVLQQYRQAEVNARAALDTHPADLGKHADFHKAVELVRRQRLYLLSLVDANSPADDSVQGPIIP